MNMRERFEDAYPPRLNGGFCKDRNWYERKDDGRWYPDIERNHQWNIWQKAWQACELSLQQQNAELLAACISAKNTMLASVDNSYAMADTIELLESTITAAGWHYGSKL